MAPAIAPARASALQPIESRADIVIVGGGIVGVSTAWWLAKRGLRATLLEKGRIAGEQSGRNWGFVRQQGRDPLEVPLMVEGNSIWRGLEGELGADIEFHQGGNLALADSDKLLASYRSWLPIAQRHGVDTRLLDGSEVKKLLPGSARDFVGGLYTPSDGHADPVKTTTAIAAAAERLGARIHQNCAVLRIETRGGAIAAIETERGRTETGHLLVAAGAWSAKLLAPLGLPLPQLVTRASVARTAPVQPTTGLGLWGPGIGMRQRRDGGFNIASGSTIDYDLLPASLRWARLYWPAFWAERRHIKLHFGTPFWRSVAEKLGGSQAIARSFQDCRVYDPTPNPRFIDAARRNLAELFPAIGRPEILQRWAGGIDIMPDAIPVLDCPGRPRGLAIATGFSGHGFAMGPIVGKLMAETFLDGKPSLTLEGFRYGRFFDGTMGPARSVL